MRPNSDTFLSSIRIEAMPLLSGRAFLLSRVGVEDKEDDDDE